MKGCHIKKYAQWLIATLFCMSILYGCGETGGMNLDDDGETPTTPETVGSVVLSSSESKILADGESTATIRAIVNNSNGIRIQREVDVTITTDRGTFAQNQSSSITTRTTNGEASVTLVSNTVPGDIATISAASEGVSAAETVQVEFGAVPASFALTTTATTVKSDNSDSATITVTVLDLQRVPIPGVAVNFSADGGQLSAARVETSAEEGSEGRATITFRSGAVDKSNKTVGITAEVPGLGTKSIPIQIVGTEITLTQEKSNLDVEQGDVSVLTINVTDAGENPVFDAEVTATVIPGVPGDPSVEAGDVQLRLTSDPTRTDTDGVLIGRTNLSGELKIDVIGERAGRATVQVAALGDTKTATYIMSSTSQTFAIIEPTDSPVGLRINQPLTIRVRNPSGSMVRFSTTFGNWNNSEGLQVVDVEVGADNIASADLQASSAGSANIQVFDVGDASRTISDSLQVFVSAAPDTATQISLQASPSVVAPSTGDVTNTSVITATVKNADDQVVGGAPVAFSIDDTTGGGEFISPVVVYTNESGVATTTFNSGSLPSSGEGVTVNAVVLGVETPPDSIKIKIGGVPGSVVIAISSRIDVSEDETSYSLPMSVLVSDANGNPVPGTRVTLGVWPIEYACGFRPNDSECEAVILEVYANEDENRNLILDPGEDKNGDGELTPPNSAAGNVVPRTEEGEGGAGTGTQNFIVITDDEGTAGFDLVYPKVSASWIRAEISASTLVAGTETRSTTSFFLRELDGEECNLFNSPYDECLQGGVIGTISLSASQTRLVANGSTQSTITALVLDAAGNVSVGKAVNFSIIQGGGSLSAPTQTTVEGGIASVIYTSPEGISEGNNVIIQATGDELRPVTVSLNLEVGDLTVDASPRTILADGIATSTISAVVTDFNGSPLAGERVIFEVDDPSKGGFPVASSTSAQTVADGLATVQFTPNSSLQGNTTATITATSPIFGVSKTITVEIVTERVGSVELVANPESIGTGGESAIITITLTSLAGNPMPAGTPVSVSTSLGTLSPTGPLEITSGDGTIRVTLISGNTPGQAMVTATSSGVQGSTTVPITTDPTQVVVGNITLTSEQGGGPQASITIPANAGNSVLFTTRVTDTSGNPVAGQAVTFTRDGATNAATLFPSGSIITNTNGEAQVRLIAQGTAGIVGISASVTGADGTFTSQRLTVNFTVPAASITVEPANTEISATQGSSTPVTITVNDINGGLAPPGTQVAVQTTRGTIVPASPVTIVGNSGAVTVSLVSDGEPGTAEIRASVGDVTGVATVTFTGTGSSSEPAAFLGLAQIPDSTDFYPDPKEIEVRGSFATTASRVVFDVFDAEGSRTDQQQIDFQIISGPNGGERLSKTADVSEAGQVSTVVLSGTRAGPVLVRATYRNDVTVSTTASVIITSGPPVGEAFGVRHLGWVEENWPDINGILSNLRMTVADIYGNPVSDGTLLGVKTYNTGGIISPASVATASGVAGTLLDFIPEGNIFPNNDVISVTAEVASNAHTNRVTSIAVINETGNPFNQVLYAGTNGGGVYKSTDSGTTWRNVSRSTTVPGQNWIEPYINDIVIDPYNNNIVYAAAGYLGRGKIYRSLDGGQNWNSNSLAETTGIYEDDAAILTMVIGDKIKTADVICENQLDQELDDSEAPWVWIGTNGQGLKTLKFLESGKGYFGLPQPIDIATKMAVQYWENSQFSYVYDIVKVTPPPLNPADPFDPVNSELRKCNAVLYAGTSIGVYQSMDGGQNWQVKDDPPFTGYTINTLALHPNSDGDNDIIYAGTKDAGVWVSTDSGVNWTQFITGLGRTIGSTIPEPGEGNTGGGGLSVTNVSTSAPSETWLVIFRAAQEYFEVIGSVSGLQAATYALTEIEAGNSYSSDLNQVTFTIAQEENDAAFVDGDQFTFQTIRDDGREIKDLLVDAVNNRLYATTYFDREPWPNPTGGVYVHELESSGAMAVDEWRDVSSNLPKWQLASISTENEGANDSAPFAQHVLAAVPDAEGNAFNPRGILVGGEGLNLYKAVSGLDSGEPVWISSKAGFTNTLMARVAVGTPVRENSIIYSQNTPVDSRAFLARGGRVEFTINYTSPQGGDPEIFTASIVSATDTGALLANSDSSFDDLEVVSFLELAEYQIVVPTDIAGTWTINVRGNIDDIVLTPQN